MQFHSLKEEVCEEIKGALAKVEEKDVYSLIDAILSVEKVFVTGTGRVMFMMQAFAKRIKHLGIDAHVAGETVEPPIGKKDLLLVGSASGETKITLAIAQMGRKRGAKIGLITASPQSRLKRLVDVCVRIPCPTKLALPEEPKSRQPMGNLFEQSLLIFGDCLAILLQERLGVTEAEMWKAHANLE